MTSAREPVVRIRCPSPADEERCRAILSAAGLVPETSLTWLLVRDAHPDVVNRLLVEGGAHGRTVVRESIGKLIGWLIDRQGALEGRARNVKSLVERTLADGGCAGRYVVRDDAALVAAAQALYRQLMADGAPFVSWERFLELFCVERAG